VAICVPTWPVTSNSVLQFTFCGPWILDEFCRYVFSTEHQLWTTCCCFVASVLLSSSSFIIWVAMCSAGMWLLQNKVKCWKKKWVRQHLKFPFLSSIQHSPCIDYCSTYIDCPPHACSGAVMHRDSLVDFWCYVNCLFAYLTFLLTVFLTYLLP